MTENHNYLYFVDSNIWLYGFSTDKKEESKRILAKELIQEKQIVISTQVINEVCFNLRKKHRLNKYQIVSFNLNILERASNLRNRYYLSFWDSLIVASALFSNANILYSEDMQDGLIVDKQLTIINPFK